MRILVVEDEKHIAAFIKQGLHEAGYAVDVAYDGQEGYFLAGTEKYNLIVLDIMLPKLNGIEVCKNLRKDKIITPILILTAKDVVDDKVTGLDAGADDYLTKPFAFKEFLARVRVLLRRKDALVSSMLKVGDLMMDLMSHKVTRQAKEIPLTVKEFLLLEYLMRHAGQVVPRTDIAESVWDIHFSTSTNIIDVHIFELRRKIDHGHKKPLIRTIRGRGYMIKA